MIEKIMPSLYEKSIEELNKKIRYSRFIWIYSLIWSIITLVAMFLQYVYIGYIGLTVILGVLFLLNYISFVDLGNYIIKLQEIVHMKQKEEELVDG